MHKEILSKEQIELLPLLGFANRGFGLVGGTAVALQIGHRRSIDFDLFSENTFDPMSIRTKLLASYKIDQTFSQGEGELTVLINKVKITFFHYPRSKFSNH